MCSMFGTTRAGGSIVRRRRIDTRDRFVAEQTERLVFPREAHGKHRRGVPNVAVDRLVLDANRHGRAALIRTPNPK